MNGKTKNKLLGLFSLVSPNSRSDTLDLRLFIYIYTLKDIKPG